MPIIGVFFFASLYAQIALGEPALKASLVLLYFFIGFAALGAPPARAAAVAARMTQSQGGGRSTASIPHFIRLDFAHASQTVFFVMAAIMAAAGLVALLGLERGRQEEPAALRAAPGTGTAEELSTP